MDKLVAYQAFARVVELGSFSAAARELGVAQPTISKQVAALEAALAVALLRRTTRRLVVTDAGERLYEAVRTILDEVDRAEASVRRLDQEPEGTLRIGLPVELGQLCVVPRLPELLRRFPQLELDIRFSDRFVDLLEEGVDLLVRVGASPGPNLVARKLGVTRRALVASPAYLEAHGAPAHPHELPAHACLVYAGGQSTAAWTLLRGPERIDVRVSPRVRADNGRALRELAVAGVGIAMLATWLVGPDLAEGRLCPVLPEHGPPPLDVVALYPSRRFLPYRARRFVEYLQEVFAVHPYL